MKKKKLKAINRYLQQKNAEYIETIQELKRHIRDIQTAPKTDNGIAWKRPEDNLPAPGESVLVTIDDFDTGERYTDIDNIMIRGKDWYQYSEGNGVAKILYWAYLPKPKED